MRGFGTFREREIGFDERFNNIERPTLLDGYFQSWRYFSSIANLLKNEIRMRNYRSTWCLQERDRLKREGFLAVHIRRGDYLLQKSSEFHGLLDEKYFVNLIRSISRKHPNQLCVISTDDPEFASYLNIEYQLNCRILVPPIGTPDLDVIELLSMAQSLVMSNSSFSWWAAWLMDSSGHVYAPYPWYKGVSINHDDLFLRHWIRCQADFR